MQTKINIIDPVSTEFNRGSFCYAPYLLYNGLKETGMYQINLMESFITERLDDIPDADAHIVCLWSYPQIDACILLAHLLPMNTGKSNIYFIGYSSLIKEYGLPTAEEYFLIDLLSDPTFLKTAIIAYPKYYKDFTNLLLSDCDMHIKGLEKGEKVYPLFTSYGCPNGCTFCPSTVNCRRNRISLTSKETIELLKECNRKGYRSIHFTDEDFFFDLPRAYEVLSGISGMGFHLIALGSADAVYDFIQMYGTDVIKNAGLEVIEIGFESGDTDVSKSMGKGKSLSKCELLAQGQDMYPFNIFWLVMTFYIGETITSLNETGRFMQLYGFNPDDVVGRLRTNGTKGGLGQYFQPYHGTGILKIVRNSGEFLPISGARLIPTYIPNSFLDSEIREISYEKLKDASYWLSLYGVYDLVICIQVGKTVRELIKDLPTFQKQKAVIYMAILARMGVIC